MGTKNILEAYCYNMKSTLENDQFKGKITDEDKAKIVNACNDTISWLDHNQMAETEDFIKALHQMAPCQTVVEHSLNKDFKIPMDLLLKKLINVDVLLFIIT